MTSITYDRDGLRDYLRGLPEPARNAAAAYVTGAGFPKLSDNGWTDARLTEFVDGIRDAVKGAGFVAFAPPLRTDTLAERIAALPDDLADHAADEAREFKCPNVRHADKWTEELWRDVDGLLGHCEAHHGHRHRSIMASLGGAGVKAADERHSIIGIATSGRTESSRELTGPEARHLATWADAKALLPETTGDPQPYTPDWKAEAKALGVTQADLLRDAKVWAKGRQLESPKKLADVTDHRLIGALLWRAGDGRSNAGEAAQAANPVVEEARDLVEALTLESEVPTEPAAAELPVAHVCRDPDAADAAVCNPTAGCDEDPEDAPTTLELAQARMAADAEREARRPVAEPGYAAIMERLVSIEQTLAILVKASLAGQPLPT